MENTDRLIVALDVARAPDALAIVKALRGEVRFFKVGLELFTACGPAIVGDIRAAGCEVFLDLKLHDIPTTVAKAAAAAAGLGAALFTVHASGGIDMMRAAVEAVRGRFADGPRVVAATVLTSMDENGLKRLGVHDTIAQQVLRLAADAHAAGLDGIVASPHEARMIRERFGKDFLIVTPGVRPSWAAANDQKRLATPADALRAGADRLVVGRPVTGAADMARAARAIRQEIAGL